MSLLDDSIKKFTTFGQVQHDVNFFWRFIYAFQLDLITMANICKNTRIYSSHQLGLAYNVWMMKFEKCIDFRTDHFPPFALTLCVQICMESSVYAKKAMSSSTCSFFA